MPPWSRSEIHDSFRILLLITMTIILRRKKIIIITITISPVLRITITIILLLLLLKFTRLKTNMMNAGVYLSSQRKFRILKIT